MCECLSGNPAILASNYFDINAKQRVLNTLAVCFGLNSSRIRNRNLPWI